MEKLKLLAFLIMLPAMAFIGFSQAGQKQDMGIQTYEALSKDVFNALAEVSDEIEVLVKINKNSVSGVDFPKGLKQSLDKKLQNLISSYSTALQQAKAVNIKIASQAQINLCTQEIDKFRKQELLPMKDEIEAYRKLDVENSDKAEAVFGLANDLSIRSGMSTSNLLMGTLNHCLVILGSN